MSTLAAMESESSMPDPCTGFLELHGDMDANCHPGVFLEFGNTVASSWQVGWIDPKSQSNRFYQHVCGR